MSNTTVETVQTTDQLITQLQEVELAITNMKITRLTIEEELGKRLLSLQSLLGVAPVQPASHNESKSNGATRFKRNSNYALIMARLPTKFQFEKLVEECNKVNTHKPRQMAHNIISSRTKTHSIIRHSHGWFTKK